VHQLVIKEVSEVDLFIIDKKSDLSHYFQDKKWVARLAYLSDILLYINELNLKLQGPDTTIFNAWNKIESFKKKLKLWLNIITNGNNEMFQSHSDYTGCPARYRTRNFFNNFTTNEDIATKFEAHYRHTLQTHSFSFLTQRTYCCKFFIGVRIIKEMPGSVASGTHCFMEANDFYSQNSVSYIIAAHLKMLLLSFEKYYP